MVSGGRVIHHLKTKIGNSRNAVVFTGYQAEGTKGRYLQERKPGDLVRFHHEEYIIEKLQVYTLDSLSAHGDYIEMSNWIREMDHKPKLILLNHGAPNSQKEFKTYLENEFKTEVKTAGRSNRRIDLSLRF